MERPTWVERTNTEEHSSVVKVGKKNSPLFDRNIFT